MLDTILQNEVFVILLSVSVTWFVQKAKAKVNPFIALAGASIVLAGFWSAAVQLIPSEILSQGGEFAAKTAAYATLIYNVIKQFAPKD